MLFVGDKGMLLSDYGKHVLLCPRRSSRTSSARRSPSRSPSGTHQEWINACKTGSPTTCPFSYSGWLTEANHLGNVAYRVGKKLEWDAEKMRVDQRARSRAVHHARAHEGVGALVTV